MAKVFEITFFHFIHNAKIYRQCMVAVFKLMMLVLLFSSCEKQEFNTQNQTDYDREILEAVNAYRAGKGLTPLVHDDFLWQVANSHSENMANGSIPFGHDGLTERSDLVTTHYFNSTYAENIAKGQGTGTELVESWLGSIGHKKNIEGNFTLTGLSAIKSADGTWYYTQVFCKPLSK
ncbi:MAG: CAP domain-containing protein [Bacteroidales bacterium]